MAHYIRRLRWLGLLLILGLLLLPTVLTQAANPTVTITVQAWVLTSPSGFTLEYVSDNEILIEWEASPVTNMTMVRAAYGHPPEDMEDGYEVYRGTGTSCTDDATDLATPSIIYYRAWSNDVGGNWTTLFSSADTGGFMSASFLFVGLILIAGFLTWFASKRPEILIALAAGLTWLALGFWLLLGDVTNLQLADVWTQLLAWVFVVMTFVPVLTQMNVAIRQEGKGHSWTAFGKEPKHESSEYEDYREKLFIHTRKGRK